MNSDRRGFFAKLFSGRSKNQKDQDEKTIFKVKTVSDIPPVVNARRLIGDYKVNEAIVLLYNSVRSDYVRYFGGSTNDSETNRQFIISSFKQFGIDIDESGFTDNYTILNKINDPPPINDAAVNQFNALRKLTTFYLDYYEKVRFSSGFHGDPEMLIEKVTDIYNYMDIIKLYFPSGETSNDGE
jgi:hypothetical protein